MNTDATLQPVPVRGGHAAALEVPAFFRYHGWMAPGVRVFRSIGFPAKAAWVSASFMLPILLLAWALWTTASGNVAQSAHERLGVAYARALMPLLDAAQNRRRAATANTPDLAPTVQGVDKALQVAADLQQRLGPALQTEAPWRKVVDLNQGLAARPVLDGASATFAAHTEFVDQVLALLNDVADNSNLALDPDADTFYLMDAAAFRQPLLIEQLGQLRGMGNAVIRAGSITAAQRELIGNALAFAKAHQAGLDKALRRALDADPSLAAEIKLDDAVAASKAFLGMTREQLLGDAPQGDPVAFVAAANRAIELHYAGIGRVLDALDARVARRVDTLRQVLWMQMGVALAGVGLAVYLLMAFYRVTQGGIAEVARQLAEISHGNLTLNPRPWGRDEVAMLMNTLAGTLVSLRRIVGQVRSGADEIQTASEEVASASMDLSRRTEEAAAHLQRTAAAMTQIGGTVQHTARTAAGATELVVRNAEVAEQGGNEVDEAVATMGGIKSSSARIEEIIGTIDGIAFQTNILALNAAVEAARAGEQGRGFAVVAGEVRALAQRCAGAAREIKGLIGASAGQVDGGSRVVGQAGHTMRQIVDNAVRVKQLIGEISDGTREQTAGLSEVGRSVAQLDGMTQQNAALVEQTAAAAASLKDNARRLAQAMETFRL